ncbi:hypothetical protein Lal_00050207 [Lupinus albus]|uniref:RING-type E3 ubiquitin transferase n=1 Tax=Lupinus albus TaxID=3870 RepID=A0A6A5LZC4_LUPAL|nr:putative transcription factor interactor and regulator LIM family [Lupinus albus]KAF1867774.1 hypothetical protein Lal_00050207 [Lupinus albus]
MGSDDLNNKASEFEYPFTAKSIIDCILILSLMMMMMISIYIYARRFFLRVHHRQNRRSHFVFYIEPNIMEVSSHGLGASVIATLPVFTFSSNSDPIECSVCLSEFEDGETGRVLPICKHSFHIECIGMWFMSHSTCPLCRVHVECPPQPEVVVNASELEPGSSSEEVNRVCSSLSRGEELVYDSAASSFKRILTRERKTSLDIEQGREETQ